MLNYITHSTNKMQGNVKCLFYSDDRDANHRRLFKDAVTSAKNGKVLYILREELTELPQLSQDLSLVNKHYMKLISFLYAINIESLIESVSTLPDWQNVPSTLILEDLGGYCYKNVQNACGIVAMLNDAALSCSLSLSTSTKLCISVTRGSLSDECCHMLKELYNISEFCNKC